MKTSLTIAAALTTLATTATARAEAPGDVAAPIDAPDAVAAVQSYLAAEPVLDEEIDVEESPAHGKLPRQVFHGFRVGYNVVMNYDKPTRDGGKSLKEEFDLETPHSMLLGYEAFTRITGESWLNVLVVGNVTVAGLEQSKFIPCANGLIGIEIEESFQLGVGINLTPDPQRPAHMIAAAGWTPRAGSFQTPVHFYVVPDTTGNHRMGATVGVTW